MNCRSMDNKSDYIFDHMVENNIDIVALTETWLPNNEQLLLLFLQTTAYCIA